MSIADQNAVISASMTDMSVVAGAGSGKTRTSIARVLWMLSRLPARRRIALLSFSNVAVDTFRDGLNRQGGDSTRVTVATFDAFFTHNVITPYAWKLLDCAQRPFLVLGDEPFLAGFAINHGGRPYCITDLKIDFVNGAYVATFGTGNRTVGLPWHIAQAAIERLGRTGAYTYNIGRYWTHLVLTRLPFVSQLLVTRYPHMMIDEAQDIGAMHWSILQVLKAHGLCMALIGDSSQAIFGFNGGDGSYMQSFMSMTGVNQFQLRTNFRSVPPIVLCANQLARRADVPDRASLPTHSGVFVVPYDPANTQLVLDRFQATILRLGYTLGDIAIICRANNLVTQVRGGAINRGFGLMKSLIKAVDYRQANQYDRAFKECLGCVNALLDPPIHQFCALINDGRDESTRKIRSKIWKFVCDPEHGLPDAGLSARDAWQPLLLSNIRSLLTSLEVCGPTFADPGRRLTTRDLEDAPVSTRAQHVRVDTVHQVKGESIDAVLYIATDQHARELMSGTQTENGRIGYVALTRARDIFWMAVPADSYPRIVQLGASLGIIPVPNGV